jgi:hypothetical protein
MTDTITGVWLVIAAICACDVAITVINTDAIIDPASKSRRRRRSDESTSWTPAGIGTSIENNARAWPALAWVNERLHR